MCTLDGLIAEHKFCVCVTILGRMSIHFHFQMASFLHDIALVGIYRCHVGLCLRTVVSGSIPGPI